MAFGGFAQQGFEFGEEVFDGVEVRRIGRQEDDLRTARGDGFTHPGHFVAAEVVGYHDIARLQGRTQHFLDVVKEGLAVHRAVQEPGSLDPVRAQGGDEGVGVPVTMGGVVHAALALGSPAVAPGHAGGHAGLIKKNELLAALLLLSLSPLLSGQAHVFSFLLAGAQSFF